MASVKKRPHGKWRARYRDASGKEHSRHFARKVDAQAWLDGVTTAVATGTYVDPKDARKTVASAAEVWAAHPEWSASTAARMRSILDVHVLPRWGAVPLNRVTLEDAQKWVNELAASGLAGGTVRKIAGVFTGIVSLGLKVSPLTDLRLPRQRLVPRKYLTALEVEALAEACDEWGDVVHFLAYTGLRWGEMAALRVGRVNMLKRRVLIEESVTEVNGTLTWSAPKDHQRRAVPFPAFLTNDLAARVADKGSGDLVFTTGQGTPLRVRNARRGWFDLAAASCGLEGLTPHELRHTAASLAVSNGANVLALQRMLGHEKASTTLDVYSDLFDEDLDAVAGALDSARERARADYLRTGEPVSFGRAQ
ncbi:site-specific integrase [Demequina sp. NBRC 110053]|uniref:tyrosine-type recombinase/integrase n=1 Tax=Demequina sp. NBRC 110053 TaxID=1570342 RepID=UPI0009FDBC79|nr:site-specific integrase [Demequina sp. NBRC 110053]